MVFIFYDWRGKAQARAIEITVNPKKQKRTVPKHQFMAA
jgi:hypothetical protein